MTSSNNKKKKGDVSPSLSNNIDSEERWRLAIEGSGDGLWDWFIGTDAVFFSHNWKSMLGYADEEISGDFNEWKIRVHPEDLSLAVQEIERHVRGETELYKLEHRLLTKAGDYKWVSAKGRVVSWAADGTPLRMIGTHRDITDRKAIESELAQYRQSLETVVRERTDELMKSNAYAKSIISTIPSALIVVNDKYEIFTANGKFFSLFRLPVGNIIGNDFCSVIGCENKDHAFCEIKDHIKRIIVGKESFFTTEKLLSTSGGKNLNISVRVSSLEDSAGKVLIVFDDITQKKYFESQILQTERLAATGRLAASIAHEINNPLQGIITHLEIIREQLPQRLQGDESYSIVRDSVIRIKNIVRQLLDIYRSSDAGKDAIDINDLITRIQSLVKHQVRMKRAHFKLRLGDNLPDLAGWPQQMHQVILNIVLNALDAIPEGGSVTVSTFQRGDDLIIKIRDTGPGVTDANVDMIFDPFFSTKKDSGVGLGLFVCQGLIKNHNGTIAVNQQYTDGAEFIITLPLD